MDEKVYIYPLETKIMFYQQGMRPNYVLSGVNAIEDAWKGSY